MKTAQIVNDPMTDRLAEVSAELTVACEQFEKHIVTQAAQRIETCAVACYQELLEHLESIPKDKFDGIKVIIARNVLSASMEANVFNKIQENAKGLHGEFAPSVITGKAIEEANVALLAWSKVSS